MKEVRVQPPLYENPTARFHLKDPRCAFTTDFSNNDPKRPNIFDLRLIYVEKLYPFLFEHVKHPPNRFINFTQTERLILQSSHVPVDEIAAQLMFQFNRNRNNENKNGLLQSTSELIGKLESQSLDVITQATRLFADIVSELQLPEVYRRALSQEINSIGIQLVTNGHSIFVAPFDTDERWIEIDMFESLGALIQAQLFNGTDRFSPELYELELAAAVGHELAHAIDIGYRRVRNLRDISHGSFYVFPQKSFPFVFQDLVGRGRIKIQQERFAAFFEKEIFRRLGNGFHPMESVRRLQASMLFRVLTAISPNKISRVIFELMTTHHLKQDHELVQVLEGYIDAHDVAYFFPFSDREVREAIINSFRLL